MSQAFTKLGIVTDVTVSNKDGPGVDSFSRARISEPRFVFDAQFTYDLAPLLYEPIAANGGAGTATVAHDTTNRCALMTLNGVNTAASAYMQTFSFHRYQPGRSQLVFVTFNFVETKANVTKFAGYSDGVNGIELQQVGTTVQLKLYSATTNGDQTKAQADWNVDPMTNGSGPSGFTLDLTKSQILVIDLQALYVGRVRVGFDIDGSIYWVHQFVHANRVVYPYIQNANRPIRCGMVSTGSVSGSTTMLFCCSSVVSEGGDELAPYPFTQETSVTAGSGTRTHMLSIRPTLVYPSGSSIPNRAKFDLSGIEGLVTSGSNAVYWELCVGYWSTQPTTYISVNSAFSGVEYNISGTGGTPSAVTGNPIVIASGYIGSGGGSSKTAASRTLLSRAPLSLNQAAAIHNYGVLTLLATGIGGTSPARMALSWTETR